MRSEDAKAVDGLMEEITEALAGLPRQPPIRVKEFIAESAGRARKAAAEWLQDFNAHGPLDIQSIKTTAHQNKFVSVVAYWAL